MTIIIQHDLTINVKLPVEVLSLVANINNKLDKIMADLNDLQAAVAEEDTVIDSAIALIEGLAAQVAALQPTQAAIDALAADIKTKKDALAASLVKNTPAS